MSADLERRGTPDALPNSRADETSPSRGHHVRGHHETGVEIHAKCVGAGELVGGGRGTEKRLVVVRIHVNVRPNTVIKMSTGSWTRMPAHLHPLTWHSCALAPGSAQ